MNATFFPDPALTANIYCAGRLDAVIFRAVAPFWRELRPRDPERLCFLWLMRYGQGGEHLKIRLHGPEQLCSLLREPLERNVTVLLASLPEGAPPPRKPERAPVIDAEDETDEHHPDRTLLWTTYRRSHVSLGGKPFLSDDRYAALFTRCLAAGCEMVLALEPGADGKLPHPVRQNTLLAALIVGLAIPTFSSEKRANYLAYHRDWLLRSLLPRHQRSDAAAVGQLQERFDERIACMERAVAAIRETAKSRWEGHNEEPNEEWHRSLAALLDYVSPLCQKPGYQLDPFASDPVFAPLFKVFHGLSNQLGLRQADEAFLHHLLLRSTEP